MSNDDDLRQICFLIGLALCMLSIKAVGSLNSLGRFKDDGQEKKGGHQKLF
jgi:hypothetical protein